MPESMIGSDVQQALSAVEQASAEGKLSAGAVTNIRQWLTEPRYAEYAGNVAEEIAANRWQELDDAFWTIIPFGTGGRRGRMNPIGSIFRLLKMHHKLISQILEIGPKQFLA